MLADIATRFKMTTFIGSMQMQKLEIPGMAERIIFDVILSEYFQLPHSVAFPLHYITMSCIMRKKLPLQALNVMIKKMPRMDLEIRHRFCIFFAFIMNHIDYQMNFDVLKKITDKESVHFKCVQDLFKQMSLITYSKKLEDILKEKNMPEQWLTKNFGDPVFVHGEDEDDIKNLLEKLKFKDEEREAFTAFLTGDDLEAKDEAKQEILFEVIFRKANRNYSFMEKVLEAYAETLQENLIDKKNVVKMLYNMFHQCHDRLVVFIELFCNSNRSIITYENFVEWVDGLEQLNENHLGLINRVIGDCIENENTGAAVKIFDVLKKKIEQAQDEQKVTASAHTVVMLRSHHAGMKDKWNDVKALFEGLEDFNTLFT